MSKILLINPPLFKSEIYVRGAAATAGLNPPLGLAYLAASLQQAGHECTIYDGVAQPSSLEETCRKAQQYDIVGITVVTAYFKRVKELILAIRSQCSPCPVIMVGGPHVTAESSDLLQAGADFGIIGEGELTSVELVKWIEDGKNAETLSDIRGIAYVGSDGEIVRTQKRPLIQNLDEIPYPARDLLPMHLYSTSPARGLVAPSHALLISRGCPGVCSFCDNNSFGHKIRYHSPERIVDEMFLLRDKYGANHIQFFDDNFTTNKDMALTVCEMLISRGFNRCFSIQSRADCIDAEILAALKRAGCGYVSYGFESGTQRVLDHICKNETIEQMYNAVKLTKEAGIKVRGFFIFGFPSETMEEMKQTLNFAKELDIDMASFTLLCPFPGTLDYKRAKASGTFDPFFYKKMILTEFNLPKEPIYTPAGISSEELLEFHKNAYSSYYLRPLFILKHLLSIRSFSELWSLAKGGYTIIANALSK